MENNNMNYATDSENKDGNNSANEAPSQDTGKDDQNGAAGEDEQADDVNSSDIKGNEYEGGSKKLLVRIMIMMKSRTTQRKTINKSGKMIIPKAKSIITHVLRIMKMFGNISPADFTIFYRRSPGLSARCKQLRFSNIF